MIDCAFGIYPTKSDHPSSVGTDSEAGKNRERQKLQISTGRRVYTQINANTVFPSDGITEGPFLR